MSTVENGVTGGIQFALVIAAAVAYFWWQRKKLWQFAREHHAKFGARGCLLYVVAGLFLYFLVGGLIAWIFER